MSRSLSFLLVLLLLLCGALLPASAGPDDAEAAKKGVKAPAEWVFPQPKPLRLLTVHGLWYPEYAMDRAYARAGGALLTDSWWNGGLRYYPESYEELMRHHVIVICNANADAFGPARRAMVKHYVEMGGGVLFLGGRFTFDEKFRGSAFEEIMPVTLPAKRTRKSEAAGLVLAAGKDVIGKGFGRCSWAQSPRVYWYDEMAPKADSKVLLTAGGKPLLIAGSFGKGRVAVFTGTVEGLPAAGQVPFWAWDGWPLIMADTLNWLAETAKSPAPGPELLTKMNAVLMGGGAKKADKIGPELIRYARIPANIDTARMMMKALGNLEGEVPLELADTVWESQRTVVNDCEDVVEQLVGGGSSAKISLGLRALGQLKMPGARGRLEGLLKDPGAGGPEDPSEANIEEKVSEDPAVYTYTVRLGALEGLGNLGDPAAVSTLQRYMREYAKAKSKPENMPNEVTKEDELYQEALLSALRCGDATAAAGVIDMLLENRYVFIRMISELDSPDYPGPEHEAERRLKARIRRDLPRVHQRQERLYGKLFPLPDKVLPALAQRIAAEEDPRVADIACAIFGDSFRNGAKLPAEVSAALKGAKIAAVRDLGN
jgi:uncharacterized membrane protein